MRYAHVPSHVVPSSSSSPRHGARLFLALLALATGLVATAVSEPAAAAPGDISTFAGDGAGDGRIATSVGLSSVAGVAVDGAGNVYIADRARYRIRRMDAVTHVITTVAGTGVSGLAHDNGPAIDAELLGPVGLAIGPDGNLYVADSAAVRQVDLASGIISTLTPFYGDLQQLAFDTNGDLYFADRADNVVRKLSAGVVSVVVGTGSQGSTGDGGPATAATLNEPAGVAISNGVLLVSDSLSHRVRAVNLATNTIVAFAGTGIYATDGDGGPPALAKLQTPGALAVSPLGLLIVDAAARRIRVVNNGTINTFAGSTGSVQYGGDGGPASGATFVAPSSIAVEPGGATLVGDLAGVVRRFAADGSHIASTIVGDGTKGYSGDGGAATAAIIGDPRGVAVLPNGDVLIADTDNHVVRRVDHVTHVITTFAGTGISGSTGDNGPANLATLEFPVSVEAISDGTVYVADWDGARIRRIDPAGTITTYAGTGKEGHTGDGGPATNAQISRPTGLVSLTNGDLLFTQFGTRIRRIDHATQIIETVAGTGANVDAGDGGPATSASFVYANAIVADADDNYYIADTNARKVRRVDAKTSMISTVAGTGAFGSSGDGGPALGASFRSLTDLALDGDGNLFITDWRSHRVRRIDAGTSVITTHAGNANGGFGGDGGAAVDATLNAPTGVAIDPYGNIFIADLLGQRVRRIDHGAVPFVEEPQDPQDPTVTTDPPPLTDPPSSTAPGSADVSTSEPLADASIRYQPVLPERLLDTRDGTGAPSTVDAGGTVVLQVTEVGRALVPADAETVVLNVTATASEGDGYVTVWPCGESRPLASNLNYTTGQTKPNLVIVKIGANGTVCLYSQRRVDLIADIEGYYPAAHPMTAVQPERLLDTRTGTGAPGAPVAANGTVSLQVTGVGSTNVPAGAAAVVLNVTVTNAGAAGYVTAWPCDQPQPTASNVNYAAGTTTANLAIVKLSAAGDVCLFSQSQVDLIADVDGWYPPQSDFTALQPLRLLDTRAGLGAPVARLEADHALVLDVAAGAPASASAVVLNVTVTEPAAPGFVTVWPCDQPRPLASNLNFVGGETTANLVITRVSSAGTICLYSQSATHLLADLSGWYAAV